MIGNVYCTAEYRQTRSTQKQNIYLKTSTLITNIRVIVFFENR